MGTLGGIFSLESRMVNVGSSPWLGIRPRRQRTLLMKIAIQALLILISLVATLRGYGCLESGANMVEMLLVPFTPAGRTSGAALVFGGPFLVLFIGASV